MEQILDNIIQFLLPQNDIFLYIFLFLSAVIENLFPPIPGDTITGLGAFLVGTGRLDYLLVYITTTVGSVAGFMLLFFVGRYLEREFFIERDYKFFSAESIINAEKWFKKYGYVVVLANRFLPGVRSVISIVSGISMLKPWKVLTYSLISASLWNLLWIHMGFILGNNWAVVKEKIGIIMRNYNIGAGIFIICIFAIYFIVKKKKKNDKNESSTES